MLKPGSISLSITGQAHLDIAGMVWSSGNMGTAAMRRNLIDYTCAVLMGYFIRGKIVPEHKNPVNRLVTWLYAALVRQARHPPLINTPHEAPQPSHTVKLIAPQFVKPFRQGQKNDWNDALAIVIFFTQLKNRVAKLVRRPENKRMGRVGDSPIVGAGVYADNEG